MEVKDKLFELQDKEYAAFHSKLVPTLPKERFIGVRVPDARKLAKSFINHGDHKVFLESLPHYYYDENLLHALLISEMKDYNECIEAIDKFLPYIDNWAVCDIMSPKVFKKHRKELLEKIHEWAYSQKTYVCRFGLGMLMKYFLDENFKLIFLEIPASIHSKEYYVNMMIAWFFATALSKQWSSAIPYIENYKLEPWVHNKVIQKACESYRITGEQKIYLRSFKLKVKV